MGGEARNRLRQLLEERMDEQWEQYLGRARQEQGEKGDREGYRNGSSLRHLLTEIGDLIVRIPREWKEIFIEGVRGLSDAVAFGGSADYGLFCLRDEYEEGFYGSVIAITRAGIGIDEFLDYVDFRIGERQNIFSDLFE